MTVYGHGVVFRTTWQYRWAEDITGCKPDLIFQKNLSIVEASKPNFLSCNWPKWWLIAGQVCLITGGENDAPLRSELPVNCMSDDACQ